MSALCLCGPCARRREARRRYYERNAATIIKVNNINRDAWRKKKRGEASDSDLDAKALASMPWRQA